MARTTASKGGLMSTGNLIIGGALTAGAYWLWSNHAGAGTTTSVGAGVTTPSGAVIGQTATPPAGATTPTQAGTGAPPANPATPASPPANAAIIHSNGINPGTLTTADIAAKVAAAAGDVSLAADGWNWYWSQASNVPQTADLFPPDNRGALMSIKEYVQRRNAAGLSGLVVRRSPGVYTYRRGQ